MIAVQGQIRRWGNSVGIRLQKKEVLKENLKEGEEVVIFVAKKDNPLKRTFGIAKFSRPIDEILKEVDREGWDE